MRGLKNASYDSKISGSELLINILTTVLLSIVKFSKPPLVGLTNCTFLNTFVVFNYQTITMVMRVR